MNIHILDGGQPAELQPLSSSFHLAELPVAGKTLREQLLKRFAKTNQNNKDLILTLHPALWPSDTLQQKIIAVKTPYRILSEQDLVLGWGNTSLEEPEAEAVSFALDEECLQIQYPWDLLLLNEMLIGAIKEDFILGTIRERVSYDGYLELGEGSVILPGVYIEGNVRIGKNCKIGPNCYIRGNTSIGDYCHIGQGTEIKNSLLLDKVSIGHLSYVGDSIIGAGSNFGAGTITANLRHDGKDHASMVCGHLVDSKRRKLGAIIGANVHTGINTSIYPGRKVWPGCCTKPGEVVSRDLF